jgi:hypothetical protein
MFPHRRWIELENIVAHVQCWLFIISHGSVDRLLVKACLPPMIPCTTIHFKLIVIQLFFVHVSFAHPTTIGGWSFEARCIKMCAEPCGFNRLLTTFPFSFFESAFFLPVDSGDKLLLDSNPTNSCKLLRCPHDACRLFYKKNCKTSVFQVN